MSSWTVSTSRPPACVHDPSRSNGWQRPISQVEVEFNIILSVSGVADPVSPVIVKVDAAPTSTFNCSVTKMLLHAEARGVVCPMLATVNVGVVVCNSFRVCCSEALELLSWCWF